MAIYSTSEVADLLGVDAWRVRRLFEVGRLPDPQRIGGKRAIPREMITEIAVALHERGWAPSVAPASMMAPAASGGAQ